jgi:hypothetical protein
MMVKSVSTLAILTMIMTLNSNDGRRILLNQTGGMSDFVDIGSEFFMNKFLIKW